MTTASARRWMRALAGAVLVGLLATTLATLPAPSAEAADPGQFRAGHIISDDVMWNKDTMSVGDIQSFLNSKVPNCSSGATCLKDYGTTTRTIPATPMCATYNGGGRESAATIIYKVAQACGVNPQVILVMLQKEQGLVTSRAPSAYAYRSAMGAGCPDTAACDANYYGLFNQIHYGAYLLKRYTQPAGTGAGTQYNTRFDLMYPVGRTSYIQYNPNASCGGRNVFVENQATHALYVYTPYVPSQAALDAGYGYANNCSAYGNRNFFLYFSDWFGSPFSMAAIAIQERWESLGGAGGVLGAALAEVRYLGSGAVRDFANGRIHYTPATGAHAVYGVIGARYDAVRGESGVLGYPLAGRREIPGGIVQDFQFGRIHYSSSTGAWEVYGAIGTRYDANRGESGPLGYPLAARETTGGVTYQRFQNGRIYTTASGAAEVFGPIGAAYTASGGPSGPLGVPLAPARTPNGGLVQDFAGGRIPYSASTGAQVVVAPMIGVYDALRGESGVLGFPTGGRQSLDEGAVQYFQRGGLYSWSGGVVQVYGTFFPLYQANRAALGWPVAPPRVVAGGTVQDFQGGKIHARSGGASFVVIGARIGARYNALRGESGVLGFPVANERATPGGFTQDFERGKIHFSSATGAWEVTGVVADRYNSLRGESGVLGYPRAAVRNVAGGQVQDFQNGRIHSGPRGAWQVYGPVGATYDSLRGESGVLGYPVAAQRTVAGGLVQDFQSGRIHYSAATGAWGVYGAIGARYDQLRGESGVLGYPVGAQYPSGGGIRQDFANGWISVSASGVVSDGR